MLDRTSSTPLWEQLEEILRDQIVNEKWEPGEAISSENALSEEYGLSRMTVRSVITRLVQEGLLYRVAGKGTFVAEPKLTATPLPYNGIREQLEVQGLETRTEVLTNKTVNATKKIANKLRIKANDPVYLIERIRKVKGKPLSFHKSYVKQDICGLIPDDRLKKEQLCKILEHDYEVIPTKVEETLELIYASNKYADIFEIKPFEPLLHLSDVIYMGNEIVEYSEVYFKGDKVKLYFEFDELKK